MDVSLPKTRLARFGLFEVDLERRLLTKGGLRVRLQDQPFQVLALLVDKPGEIVTRDEIRQCLWPADTYVAFDDGLNTAIKKLRAALSDSSDNPKFIETVPRRGYRFLAPVTFPSPASSDALNKPEPNMHSEIVVAAQERSRLTVEQRTPRSAPIRVGVGLILAVGLAFAGYVYRSTRTSGHQSQASKAGTPVLLIASRSSLAVIGFRNLSHHPEEEWLSPALSEMLDTEMAAGEKLRIISAEEVSRAKQDLALVESATLASESLSRLRARIGADYVVAGSYTSLGKAGKNRLRLDLHIQDTRSGETIAEESVSGNEQELFDLVSQAGERLRQRLSLQDISNEQLARGRASLPANVEAARFYTEGLSKLRVFDALSARDLLVRAIAADHDFPLAHSALSSALWQLGYEMKAQEEAKHAMDLSSGLLREEQLSVEALYRERTKDWAKATQIYRTLVQFFPDNPEYAFRLSAIQTLSGSPGDAIKTLESLRGLRTAANDPLIDLLEARANQASGDFSTALRLAESAAAKGREQGASLVVAQAMLSEGRALERLGNYDRATVALQASREAFAHAGDLLSAAETLRTSGNVSYRRGEFESARANFEEALLVFHRLGSRRMESATLNDIGNILYTQDQLSEAKSYYERVLAVDRDLGSKANLAGDLGNLANVLDAMGRLTQARKMQEEVLQEFTASGDKRGTASTLDNLGNLFEELGELSGAARYYEQAYKLDQETGYRRGTAFVLSGWSQVLMDEDKLAEARAKLEEGMNIRQQLGEHESLAESQLALAQLALQEERFTDAEQGAREAAEQFAKSKFTALETTATAILARSYLGQRKVTEAKTAAGRATAAARRTGYVSSLLDAKLASALVLAARDKFPEADKHLNRVGAEATKEGYAGYRLAARLELGKLHIRMKRIDAAAELTTLERDAKSKGYLLIARKAAEARSRPGTN